MEVGAGATLPWSWYSDPDVLRLERDRIFRRTWQYAGHLGQLPEPGSYFTAAAGDIPVVVTRARDGELRAFLNVCRHRGFAVADGQGTRETLQCGYHAWTYGLDGSLKAAPRTDTEPGFDRDGLGLRPARVETWGPLVFVNLDDDAAPLADALGPLPDQLADALDVDALEHRLRVEFEVEANWKIVCENFLECYHCPVAHPGFSELVDVAPDAYGLSTDGLTSSQFGPLRDRAAGSPFAGGEIEQGQFHFLWPSFGLNVFPGRPNLSCGPILPAGPERTRRFLDYFFAPGENQAWIDDLLELDDQVGREDRALVEGVQRGVRAGVLERGRLVESAERLISHFQGLTARALTG